MVCIYVYLHAFYSDKNSNAFFSFEMGVLQFAARVLLYRSSSSTGNLIFTKIKKVCGQWTAQNNVSLVSVLGGTLAVTPRLTAKVELPVQLHQLSRTTNFGVTQS